MIRIARDLGYQVHEKNLVRTDLYFADEAFFTGTAVELTPIRELDGRQIGTGRPGPVTTQVQELFFSIVRGGDSRYASWLTPI